MKISQCLIQHIAIGPNNENMVLPAFFEKNEEAGSFSFLLNIFQDDSNLKIFSKFLLFFGFNAPR